MTCICYLEGGGGQRRRKPSLHTRLMKLQNCYYLRFLWIRNFSATVLGYFRLKSLAQGCWMHFMVIAWILCWAKIIFRLWTKTKFIIILNCWILALIYDITVNALPVLHTNSTIGYHDNVEVGTGIVNQTV